MERKIRHVILTRFNVASPGREHSIRLRQGWLDGRFELFERYCLPSVQMQSNQDFEWIIFFDEQTPEKYRKEISRLQSIFPFKAVYTGLFRMKEIVPQIFGSDSKSEWLLTTRLDSDDVLAVDFAERLRNSLQELRPMVINFPDGVILSVGETNRLYRTQDDSNPFASLLEPTGDKIKTIWGENHVDIQKLADVVQLQGPPAWLQLVHGANVSNRIKGKRIPLRSEESLFGCLRFLSRNAHEKNTSIALENIVIHPLRQCYEICRAVAKLGYTALSRN